MQSAATDVTAYIAEAPPARQECLTALQSLCRESLTGYEETMRYGMPAYTKNGVIEIAFASQRNHISLYVLKHDVVEANRDGLAGLSVGKGCIRYSRPEKIDFAVVRKLLADTVASLGPAC